MERNMVLHIDDAILRKAFLYVKIKGGGFVISSRKVSFSICIGSIIL